MSIKFSNLQIYRKSLYHLQEVLKINTKCKIFGTVKLQPAAFQREKVKGRSDKKDVFEGSKYFLPNSVLTTT